jgi:hypothetical protein
MCPTFPKCKSTSCYNARTWAGRPCTQRSSFSTAVWKFRTWRPRNQTSFIFILSRIKVVTVRRGMDRMIGFADTLYTVLGTTGNNSAIADLHTLQFTVTHALGFSVFTSRILVTDFNKRIIPAHCNYSTHDVYFAQPNFFLAISSQSLDCRLHGLP